MIDISWQRRCGEAADASSVGFRSLQSLTIPQVHIDHLHRRQIRQRSVSAAAVRWRISASSTDVPRHSPTGSSYRRALFAVTSRPTDRKFGRWVRTGSWLTDCRVADRCQQTCPPGGASPRLMWCCRGSKDMTLRRCRLVEPCAAKVSPYRLKFADRRRPRSTTPPHPPRSPSTDEGRLRLSRAQEELTWLALDVVRVQSPSRHHISMPVQTPSATRQWQARSRLLTGDREQRPRLV